jgi:hypothetical protein
VGCGEKISFAADQVYPPGDLPGGKHCRSPGNTVKIIRQDLQDSQVLVAFPVSG